MTTNAAFFRGVPIAHISPGDHLHLNYNEASLLQEFMGLPAFQRWAAGAPRLTPAFIWTCPLLHSEHRYDGGDLGCYMGWMDALNVRTPLGPTVGDIFMPKLIAKMDMLWPVPPIKVQDTSTTKAKQRRYAAATAAVAAAAPASIKKEVQPKAKAKAKAKVKVKVKPESESWNAQLQSDDMATWPREKARSRAHQVPVVTPVPEHVHQKTSQDQEMSQFLPSCQVSEPSVRVEKPSYTQAPARVKWQHQLPETPELVLPEPTQVPTKQVQVQVPAHQVPAPSSQVKISVQTPKESEKPTQGQGQVQVPAPAPAPAPAQEATLNLKPNPNITTFYNQFIYNPTSILLRLLTQASHAILIITISAILKLLLGHIDYTKLVRWTTCTTVNLSMDLFALVALHAWELINITVSCTLTQVIAKIGRHLKIPKIVLGVVSQVMKAYDGSASASASATGKGSVSTMTTTTTRELTVYTGLSIFSASTYPSTSSASSASSTFYTINNTTTNPTKTTPQQTNPNQHALLLSLPLSLQHLSLLLLIILILSIIIYRLIHNFYRSHRREIHIYIFIPYSLLKTIIIIVVKSITSLLATVLIYLVSRLCYGLYCCYGTLTLTLNLLDGQEIDEEDEEGEGEEEDDDEDEEGGEEGEGEGEEEEAVISKTKTDTKVDVKDKDKDNATSEQHINNIEVEEEEVEEEEMEEDAELAELAYLDREIDMDAITELFQRARGSGSGSGSVGVQGTTTTNTAAGDVTGTCTEMDEVLTEIRHGLANIGGEGW